MPIHNDFKDSDNDGLSDEAEGVFGTDPENPDTDGDGMQDGDEVVRGRNPLGPGMLKDLFIPHAGNNYHPHSLHPKRLLFHAGTVLAIKALVIVFMLALPVSAWLTPDILRQQQQKIIQLTNEVRLNLGIAALGEHERLNQAADYKAEDMLQGQYFAHQNPDGKSLAGFLRDAGYIYGVAGENLAIGFADAESVVEAWVQSPTHYNNLVHEKYSDIGVGLVSGEFEGTETTLIAQYFGAPFALAQAPEEAPAPVELVSEPVPESVPTQEPQVAPEQEPASQALGATEEQEAAAPTQPAETVPAEPAATEPAEPAQVPEPELHPDTEAIASPVINPPLQERYFFMREQESGIIKSLLTVSSTYFTILLVLAVISLLLMVFIEIRKQHPRHIASSLGLIALLGIAIIL